MSRFNDLVEWCDKHNYYIPIIFIIIDNEDIELKQIKYIQKEIYEFNKQLRFNTITPEELCNSNQWIFCNFLHNKDNLTITSKLDYYVIKISINNNNINKYTNLNKQTIYLYTIIENKISSYKFVIDFNKIKNNTYKINILRHLC